MTEMAVNTQADVMERASPAVQMQTDYELARAGIPGLLLQMEGLLHVSPENERLLLLGAKSLCSYAYAFLEDEREEAELHGNLEQADRARARARTIYLRARDLGLRLLKGQEPDLAAVVQRDPDALRDFLTERFTDQADAPALLWTGYAWGSAVGAARDDLDLVADLPLALELVERSVQLDEGYYHAAGHTFLGAAKSSRGRSIGGDPEKGRAHFERALVLTGRRALLVQVSYAQHYAVQKQDRELFLALVHEVSSAPNPAGSELSLSNTVAQRRAARLRAQVDTLILPPLPEAPTAWGSTGAGR